MSNTLSPEESKKEFIRIALYDEKGNIIKTERKDGYDTSVDWGGYEDLSLREDAQKIELYKSCEYIELYQGKTYKVIKRTFMPCVPVCLFLYLKEVDN